MGKQSKSKKQRRDLPPASATPQFTDQEPTTAIAWKRNKGREAIRLPSGNVALVRRVGPEAFMEQDVMPDSLAPIIQRAIHDKRGLPPKALEKALLSPDGMGKAVEMIDRLCCYAVIEPTVLMPPGCVQCGGLDNADNRAVHEDPNVEGHHTFLEADRNPGVVYVDDVEFDDKVFIMNFAVGGTRDLERFRQQHTEAVGSVDAQPSLEGETV